MRPFVVFFSLGGEDVGTKKDGSLSMADTRLDQTVLYSANDKLLDLQRKRVQTRTPNEQGANLDFRRKLHQRYDARNADALVRLRELREEIVRISSSYKKKIPTSDRDSVFSGCDHDNVHTM